MEEEKFYFWEVKTYQDETSMRVVEKFINPENENDFYFKGIAMGQDTHGNRRPFDFSFAENMSVRDCFEKFDEFAEEGAKKIKAYLEAQAKEVKKEEKDIVLPKSDS